MGVDDGVPDIIVSKELDDGFKSDSSDGSSGVTVALFTVGAGVLLLSLLATPVQTSGGMMPLLQAVMDAITGNTAVAPSTIAGSPQTVVINIRQPSPTGIRMECPGLPRPENGNVEVACNPPTCIATYSCVQGYVINGNSIRTCTSAEWTGTVPRCVLFACPILDEPANGTVATTCMSADNLSCIATYSCVVGQEIEGTGLRNCSSGLWDGNDPTCIIPQF